MLANTQMGGLDTGGPDVCKTPAPPAPAPVPIPYPNASVGVTATGFVARVLICGAPAHNLGTNGSMSNLDEPGCAGGGVASNKIDGGRKHTTFAVTVLIGGQPATRLTSTTVQNSNNTMGIRAAPSQIKVLILGG